MKKVLKKEKKTSKEDFGKNKVCIGMEDMVSNLFQYKQDYIES